MHAFYSWGYPTKLGRYWGYLYLFSSIFTYLISNGCFELEDGSCFSLPIQRHSHTKHSFFWLWGDRCRFGDVFAPRTVWLAGKVPMEQVQEDISPKIEVTEYTADPTTWPWASLDAEKNWVYRWTSPYSSQRGPVSGGTCHMWFTYSLTALRRSALDSSKTCS